MQVRIEKDGAVIRSVDDWFRLAPPKMGMLQWKDGRSAKELAKAFCIDGATAIPAEITAVLDSHPDLRDIHFVWGIPEHPVALDSFRGETRNADLVLVGESPIGRVAVSVEAKADESFGDLIGDYLQSITNPRSNVPKRIEALRQAIFPAADSAVVAELRYRLLHAVAGTLIYAAEQGAEIAIFIIYELTGLSCMAENLARNQDDLDRFVAALIPACDGLPAGHALGPVRIPGAGRVSSSVPLYLAKAHRQLTS